MARHPFTVLALAGAALSAAAAAHADTFPRYQVVDMGPGVAQSSRPGLGVVGNDDQHRAIRWVDGAKRVLPATSEWSGATQLNAQGVMAGGVLGPRNLEHPVRWTADGQLQDLYQSGDPGAGVSGLDDTGRLIGYWYRSGGVRDGFVVEADGQRHAFPFFGAGDWSIPVAISPAGLVAAEVNDAPGGPRLCARYAAGAFEILTSPPQSRYCSPVAVNDAGDVAAVIGTPLGPIGAVWHGGQWTSLGTNVNPRAINKDDVVVGLRSTSRRGGSTAFVSAQGVVRRLDTLLDASATGWRVHDAYGIDDAGQISGTGRGPGQRTDHAVLLVPVSR